MKDLVYGFTALWLFLAFPNMAVAQDNWELPTEGCEKGDIAPNIPCATFNLTVEGVDNRVYRIVQEMTRNQSSRVTAISETDKVRIDSYYSALSQFITDSGTNPLDLHYLELIPLTDLYSLEISTENEDINSALKYLVGAVSNLRVSQSTRLNDGLLPQDMIDLQEAVAKSQALVDSFYATHNPIDMPQSNPRQPVMKPTIAPQGKPSRISPAAGE